MTCLANYKQILFWTVYLLFSCESVFANSCIGSLGSKEMNIFSLPVLSIKGQVGPTCVTYSFFSGIEHLIKQNSGQEISLSVPYFTVQLFRRKLNAPNDSYVSPYPIPAYDKDFTKLLSEVKYFGLVPEEIFHPIVPYSEWHSRKINGKTFIEQIGSIKDALRYHRKGEIYDREIDQAFLTYIGSIPEEFEWEGQQLTPTSFRQKYFPIEKFHFLKIREGSFEDGNILKGFNREVNASHYSVHHSDFKDIETALIRHMAVEGDLGSSIGSKPTSVFILIDWVEKNLDRSAAQFSLDYQGATDINELHAMQIVGYRRDSAGEIQAWKLQNSHRDVDDKGQSRPNSGFVWVERSYMKRYFHYGWMILNNEP